MDQDTGAKTLFFNAVVVTSMETSRVVKTASGRVAFLHSAANVHSAAGECFISPQNALMCCPCVVSESLYVNFYLCDFIVS